jgi:hypothetical protein
MASGRRVAVGVRMRALTTAGKATACQQAERKYAGDCRPLASKAVD